MPHRAGRYPNECGPTPQPVGRYPNERVDTPDERANAPDKRVERIGTLTSESLPHCASTCQNERADAPYAGYVPLSVKYKDWVVV